MAGLVVRGPIPGAATRTTVEMRKRFSIALRTRGVCDNRRALNPASAANVTFKSDTRATDREQEVLMDGREMLALAHGRMVHE